MKKTIDLILVLALIAMAVPIVVSAVDKSNVRAEREIVEREALKLYQAFLSFYQRNGEYPKAFGVDGFEPTTLNPLIRRGYYDGSLLTRLLEARVDAYDSPDDRGRNQEFWLEMTLAEDPAVRLVVARSDNAPLGGGQWLDGVYVRRVRRLEAL
jgi:type II secretory pathway pseudopilin PulG